MCADEPKPYLGQRFAPDDAREWVNRARSSLAKAGLASDIDVVYLEDLCFDAQQAADKAIKAVLIYLGIGFPYVHDLAGLVALVEQAGVPMPPPVARAPALSDYAVEPRYPGLAESVTQQEYEEALAVANAVVRWAEGVIGVEPPKDA